LSVPSLSEPSFQCSKQRIATALEKCNRQSKRNDVDLFDRVSKLEPGRLTHRRLPPRSRIHQGLSRCHPVYVLTQNESSRHIFSRVLKVGAMLPHAEAQFLFKQRIREPQSLL
jgi:hypothetical protein